MATSPKFNTDSWNEYYAAQGTRKKSSPLLARAIRLDNTKTKSRIALDLGCGTGSDTLFLLKKGYTVHAIDAQKDAIKKLRKNVPLQLRKKLVTRVIRFEHILQRDLPKLSLINASFSIFFCRPSSFAQLWRNLTRRLEKEGVFCGQFLARRDDWAKRRGYTSISRNVLEKLFSNFEVLQLSEYEDDSGTLTGSAKHWHFYTVLARKKYDI